MVFTISGSVPALDIGPLEGRQKTCTRRPRWRLSSLMTRLDIQVCIKYSTTGRESITLTVSGLLPLAYRFWSNVVSCVSIVQSNNGDRSNEPHIWCAVREMSSIATLVPILEKHFKNRRPLNCHQNYEWLKFVFSWYTGYRKMFDLPQGRGTIPRPRVQWPTDWKQVDLVKHKF